MIHFIIYVVSAYLMVGTIIYVWGHPLRERILTTVKGARVEGGTNTIYRHLAHSAQAINFLVHSVSATATEQTPAPIMTLYKESILRAFNPKHLFITTGAPHSRGLYLRNFAWFYPNLLNPATIIDEADRENRTILLERSLRTALETMGAKPYTTTIIPLTPRHFAAVNYVTPPSDSLLGILAGIEQLPTDITAALIAQHKNNIECELARIAKQLKPVRFNNKKYLLPDARKNMSSATDTRSERMRFVVSANIWTTFAKAERLNLMNGNVFTAFGLEKTQYKKDILYLFGNDGYIRNSLDPTVNSPHKTENITLDFAHINNGFWDLSQSDEQMLFKNTADQIFSDPTFHDISNNCYFVSNKNPECDFLHKYTTPSYHGRTAWSSFNVEFADRLLDLTWAIGDETYRHHARCILSQLKKYTERNGGYPELVDADGTPYRTWIYKSAIADSWFPRFVEVWHKAFGLRLDGVYC
jgi:hypothetical protein